MNWENKKCSIIEWFALLLSNFYKWKWKESWFKLIRLDKVKRSLSLVNLIKDCPKKNSMPLSRARLSFTFHLISCLRLTISMEIQLDHCLKFEWSKQNVHRISITKIKNFDFEYFSFYFKSLSTNPKRILAKWWRIVSHRSKCIQI